MQTVQFLKLPSGEEIYLHEPPADLAIGDEESIIEREVSEQEYNRITDTTLREFKLYDAVEGTILSRFAPPTEIDYRLLNLHRNEILDKGLPIQVDYYQDFDGESYTDLVVREVYHYRFIPGSRQVPYHQRIAIQWMRRDGSVGHVKYKERYFTGTEPLKWQRKRKNTNVMQIKAILTELFTTRVGAEEGLEKVDTLFDSLFNTIETYIKGREQHLIDELASYAEPALNYPIHKGAGALTIREYVMAELDIPLVQPAS